jgi:hypothetical protein
MLLRVPEKGKGKRKTEKGKRNGLHMMKASDGSEVVPAVGSSVLALLIHRELPN